MFQYILILSFFGRSLLRYVALLFLFLSSDVFRWAQAVKVIFGCLIAMDFLLTILVLRYFRSCSRESGLTSVLALTQAQHKQNLTHRVLECVSKNKCVKAWFIFVLFSLVAFFCRAYTLQKHDEPQKHQLIRLSLTHVTLSYLIKSTCSFVQTLSGIEIAKNLQDPFNMPRSNLRVHHSCGFELNSDLRNVLLRYAHIARQL